MMVTKDRQSLLLAIFVLGYGADDVEFNNYPDPETFSVKKYVTFTVNDVVKHCLVEEIDIEMDDDLMYFTGDSTIGEDGVMILADNGIYIFQASKMRQASLTSPEIGDHGNGILSLPKLHTPFVVKLKYEDGQCSKI